jgi:hypothetical protein
LETQTPLALRCLPCPQLSQARALVESEAANRADAEIISINLRMMNVSFAWGRRLGAPLVGCREKPIGSNLDGCSFKLGIASGQIERSETHHGGRCDDGFRCAQPMLCAEAVLQIARVPPYMLGMRGFRVSPRGTIYFCLFVALLGAAIMADGGTGYGNVVWRILRWGVLLVGSLLLLTRLWAARHDPDAARHIEAKGLYGLTPPKLRDWLFGDGPKRDHWKIQKRPAGSESK